MKRTIPLLITAIAGFILIVSYFVPALQHPGEEAAIWFDILAAIAFVLGGANLFRLQLQKISDRQSGWGYAAITLIFFVGTLLLGLGKIGTIPEASSEAYGETFVDFPLDQLPLFESPIAEIPVRGDGKLIPKSARQQIQFEKTKDGNLLRFRGWMSQQQHDDLISHRDQLEWKCEIEHLSQLAVPPAALKGKLRYDADHSKLAFKGSMSDADKEAFLALFDHSEIAKKTADYLYDITRRETAIEVAHVPENFSIPEGQRELVQLDEGILRVKGPISVGLRENLANVWTNPPKTRPSTEAQRAALLAEIEQRGKPLTEAQSEAFSLFFAADWKPGLLVQVLNTAGAPEPTPKTSCELLTEIRSGATDPDLSTPAPPPIQLNDAQINLIQEFTLSGDMSQSALAEGLAAQGEFTPAQQDALASFFSQLPNQADQMKALCFRLLEVGHLAPEQRDYLLSETREQFAWRQRVGELFINAHQIKYRWSGDYTGQGSPFWWLYEYIYQPLLTTTFAVLAFYVASAAFRAFRAKNLEAILLLGTAFIILLGRTSAGPALTSWIPDQFSAFRLDQMTVYIMSIFNTAGNRAIMIGVALGTVSTSLQVLLGIDRSYLGRGDD
ncbi:hypothetical protein SH668x_001837 [Planctomicrobium sp. SH668]|uniref:hypothetical protein n=1 Tax=Planctomicrobium sp. SH668 TaxID=3448126 RepID=UPI003F5B6DBF